VRDLCQHMMDLVENGVAAGASAVSIALREDEAEDRLSVDVEDDGRGMEPEVVERTSDPFFTTRKSRRVGLGLSLLEAACQRSAGTFTVHSSPGCGTRVECSFRLSHIDTPPLGDVVSTLTVLIALHPEVRLRYEHRAGARRFRLDTEELRAALGEAVPLGEPAAVGGLKRRLLAEWESFREGAAAPRRSRAGS
jgi:hypothetical protein